MIWIAPSEKDQATGTLENRFWAAADQLRAHSGLTSAQYSQPVLGLIFLRFAEIRFLARRVMRVPIVAGILGVVAFACARTPLDLRHVVLSYRETVGHCIGPGCATFELRIGHGGHVEFRGLRGCAVPGVQRDRIPEADFTSLVQAFHDARFFDVARLDSSRIRWSHVRVIELVYRDDQRVHETIDANREHPALSGLAKRLREAVPLERFLKPSILVYRELVRGGWDVNTVGEDGENALTSTVLAGDRPSAELLLKHGATVTPTALLHSASLDGEAIARLLIQAGRTDLRGPQGSRLLVMAARRSEAVTRYLVDGGADVNAAHPDSGDTALTAAVSSGSLANTRLLLSRGADPNRANPRGDRPLMMAARGTNTGFITLLASHGADLNGRDRTGRTALMHAAEICYEWNVRALLAAGADATLADPRGATALDAVNAAPGYPKCRTTREAIEAALRSRTVPTGR